MNEKDRLFAEKQAEKKKALEDGLSKIKMSLSKEGGKFSYFDHNERINPKTGKLEYHVFGYTSGLLNVYIDVHNMEISISGSIDKARILTSNKAMLAHPEAFLELLGEFQSHYEKLSVNAQRPKKH